MKYTLKVYNLWEYGQRKDSEGRPHQEDSLYPAYGEATDTDRLFILCDGMGGHDAGEVASATVCETLGGSIKRMQKGNPQVFNDMMLQQGLMEAFAALDVRDSGAEKKMGTTMTFLSLNSAGATIAHMGDSRVYQIRPGATAETTTIVHETEDHSLINDLIRIGELTAEDAARSTKKNVITRAMQPHMSTRPRADVFHTTDIRPGDYFFMCSDGMLEQTDSDNLRFIFSELGGDDANKMKVLKNVTEDNQDNHTAIVVHILNVEGAPTPLDTTGREMMNLLAFPYEQSESAPAAPAAPTAPVVPPTPGVGQPPTASGVPPIPVPQPPHGTPLPNANMELAKAEQKAKNTKNMLYGVIAIVVFLLVILCFSLFGGKETKQTTPTDNGTKIESPANNQVTRPEGSSRNNNNNVAPSRNNGRQDQPNRQPNRPGIPERLQPGNQGGNQGGGHPSDPPKPTTQDPPKPTGEQQQHPQPQPQSAPQGDNPVVL